MSCDNTSCPICFEKIELFAYGECNHPLCYVCFTRLRILTKDINCPLCRLSSPKALMTWDFRNFNEIETKEFIFDEDTNLYFEDQDGFEFFCDLVDHVCEFCPRPVRYRHYENFLRHLESSHGKFHCNLCTENCNLFTFERRVYSRSSLARHKTEGFDCAENNVPIHPLCQICHHRYYDVNSLYLHQKLDHFFCPLCSNTFIFYGKLEELEAHLKKLHFVCSVGDCRFQKPSNAFNTEIELNLHMASQHKMSQGSRNSVNFISTYSGPSNHVEEETGVSGDNDSFVTDRIFFSYLTDEVGKREQPRGCWAVRRNGATDQQVPVANPPSFQRKVIGVWAKNRNLEVPRKVKEEVVADETSNAVEESISRPKTLWKGAPWNASLPENVFKPKPENVLNKCSLPENIFKSKKKKNKK